MVGILHRDDEFAGFGLEVRVVAILCLKVRRLVAIDIFDGFARGNHDRSRLALIEEPLHVLHRLGLSLPLIGRKREVAAVVRELVDDHQAKSSSILGCEISP